MAKFPFVSIVAVNHNGKKFLKDFLNSALSLNYPKDKYEIIVVDNDSNDGSSEFIKRNFSKVRVLKVDKNLGFGKGNNYGIKRAKGKLFFLVNNDTALTRNALKNIVSCFLRWTKKKKIGAVNSKLVLFDSYLPVKLKDAFFDSYKIPAPWMPVNKENFVISHETSKYYTERVYLPISHLFDQDVKVILALKRARRKSFAVYFGKKLFIKGKFGSKEKIKKLIFYLTKDQLKQNKVDLIQNAGSFLFRDGFGRDRGACVIRRKQFYEPDEGQYDKEEFIPAFCGSGVLLNKKALEEIGLFDNDFFMYYEDSEMSLRMKEAGWQILFCPSSVIRHIHAATSKEWSAFFIFHVEKNRLLLLAKHWPRLFAIKEWLKYLLKDTLAIFIYHLINQKTQEGLKKFKVRLRVNLSLIEPFFVSLFMTRRMSYGQIKKFL